ncbi:MAG: hypothetical protein QOC71_482 [Thermoplasmata archaeon]|nr:hypothetical protein [Thermoplasmata archaeon]
MGLEKGCVTVMSAADGTTSIYNSSGGGTIGYGEYPEPATASKALVAAARLEVARFPLVQKQPLPPPGVWAINVVTKDGVRRVEAPEAALQSSSHPLNGLFVKTHEVIAACRVQEWKKEPLHVTVRRDRGILVSNGPNPEPTLVTKSELQDSIETAKKNGSPARMSIEKGADASLVESLFQKAGLAPQTVAMPALPWPKGAQALHIAAAQGRTEVLAELTAQGSSADPVDDFHRTPLHIVADLGRADSTKALLAGGANVNALDQQGNTPLMMAAQKGRAEVVRLLLEWGADTSTRPSHGFTALGIAQQNGHQKVIELLQKAGAKA